MSCSYRRLRGFLTVTTMSVLLTGCGPSYHIRRLQDPALGRKRLRDLAALSKQTEGAEVTAAVIGALSDPDPAIRSRAARSLGSLRTVSDAVACEALVPLLNDDEDTWHCSQVFLMYACSKIGPVREDALASLRHRTGADYGFDIPEWKKHVESAYKATADSHVKQE